MKNTLTDNTKAAFSKILLENTENMAEHTRENLLSLLVAASVEINRHSVKGFSDDYTTMAHQLESNKKMFLDHIENLRVTTKRLLKELEQKGVVSYDVHPKTGMKMAKTTSSVVHSMCEFLNSLNELVTLFYKDVYKIEDVKEKIITQQNLF